MYMRFLIRVSREVMNLTTSRIESRRLRCLKMIFSRRGAELKIAYVFGLIRSKSRKVGLTGGIT